MAREFAFLIVISIIFYLGEFQKKFRGGRKVRMGGGAGNFELTESTRKFKLFAVAFPEFSFPDFVGFSDELNSVYETITFGTFQSRGNFAMSL